MAFPTGPSASRRPPLRLATILVAAAAIVAGACSEELPTSATCAVSALCDEQSISVQQVELTPVTFDTTLTGYPLRGTEVRLLAARSGDSLDTRAIYRFDSLRTKYLSGTDSVPITEVFAPVVEVSVFRRGQSSVPQATTVQLYDVAVTGDDTSTTQLAAAFTPARLLGTATLQPRASGDTTTADTLRFAIPPAVLLAKIQDNARLRVGIRVAPGQNAQLSLSPTAARVAYRASSDTTTTLLQRAPLSETPEGQSQLRIDLSSFTIVVAGTPATDPAGIAVGGMPGRRALLRFAIPASIVDSTQILSATLVLTKQGGTSYLGTDTLYLQPLAITASAAVTDLQRRILLAANPLSPFTGRNVLPATPIPVQAGTPGVVELAIPELVGAWRTIGNVGYAPELVLTSALEGASAAQVRFHASDAPAALRPKLRISYIRRIDFAIP